MQQHFQCFVSTFYTHPFHPSYQGRNGFPLTVTESSNFAGFSVSPTVKRSLVIRAQSSHKQNNTSPHRNQKKNKPRNNNHRQPTPHSRRSRSDVFSVNSQAKDNADYDFSTKGNPKLDKPPRRPGKTNSPTIFDTKFEFTDIPLVSPYSSYSSLPTSPSLPSFSSSSSSSSLSTDSSLFNSSPLPSFVADSPSELPEKLLIVNKCLQKCAELGKWSEAMALLTFIKNFGLKPSARNYSAAITACGRARMAKQALQVLTQMEADLLLNFQMSKPPYRRPHHYQDHVPARPQPQAHSKYSKHFQPHETNNNNNNKNKNTGCHHHQSQFEIQNQSPSDDSTQNNLQNQFTNLDDDPKLKGWVVCYGAAIYACARGKMWKEAVAILKRMRAKGIPPNVICFNSAITACEKDAQLKPALDLFREMLSLNITPNIITYNALISCCEKARNSKAAIDLLDHLELQNSQLENKASSLSSDSVATPSVNTAGVDPSGPPQDSKKSKPHVSLVTPDVVTYTAAIAACAHGGNSNKALALLKKMKAANIKPNRMSYLAAIWACQRSRRGKKALELLAEMQKQGLNPDTKAYCVTMSALERCGRFQEAIQLFRTALLQQDNTHKLDIVAFNTVISCCAKSKQKEAALNFFDAAFQAGLNPNTITYNTLIEACRHAGDTLKIFDLVHSMLHHGLRPDSYTANSIVLSYQAEPCKVLDLIQSLTERNLSPGIIIYNAALQVFLNCRAGRDALLLFKTIRQCNDVKVNLTSYNITILACQRAGLWLEAINLRATMKSDAIIPNNRTYYMWIVACGQAQQWVKAVEFIDELLEKKLKPNKASLSTSLVACEKLGWKEKGMALLEQARVLGYKWVHNKKWSTCFE